MSSENLESLKIQQKKMLDNGIEALKCLTTAGEYLSYHDDICSSYEQEILRKTLDALYGHVGYLAVEYFSQKD